MNVSVSPDRLLCLILDYKNALVALEAKGLEDDDLFMAVYEEDCAPFRDQILACKEPVKTVEGLEAVILMARAEMEDGDSPLVPHLLDAAITFFRN